MKYAWIAKHIVMWPITLMCEVLGVSASGFFEHRSRTTSHPAGKPSSGRVSNEALLAHIRAVHAHSKQEYGWPRVWKELLARGIRVGKDRVQRMMKAHGIKARGKRKFVVTTDSRHDLPVAENLLARNFTPAAPDRVWSAVHDPAVHDLVAPHPFDGTAYPFPVANDVGPTGVPELQRLPSRY